MGADSMEFLLSLQPGVGNHQENGLWKTIILFIFKVAGLSKDSSSVLRFMIVAGRRYSSY